MTLADFLCPCLWWLRKFTNARRRRTPPPPDDNEVDPGDVYETPKKQIRKFHALPRRRCEEGGSMNWSHSTGRPFLVKTAPSPTVLQPFGVEIAGRLQIAGLVNSVSKYLPSRRVAFRTTPFSQRVEDEMARESLALTALRQNDDPR